MPMKRFTFLGYLCRRITLKGFLGNLNGKDDIKKRTLKKCPGLNDLDIMT